MPNQTLFANDTKMARGALWGRIGKLLTFVTKERGGGYVGGDSGAFLITNNSTKRWKG